MGVVAPVSAVGAALVPVLVGTLGGERLSLLVWAGIVAALPGIWLVSRTPEDPLETGAPRESVAAGAVDGALAGLGFGLLFAALGQVPDGPGWWPLAVCQAASVPAVVLLAPGPARGLGAARACGAARRAVRPARRRGDRWRSCWPPSPASSPWRGC